MPDVGAGYRCISDAVRHRKAGPGEMGVIAGKREEDGSEQEASSYVVRGWHRETLPLDTINYPRLSHE